MGRVKDFYWDEINKRVEEAPPDPPDIEEFYAEREIEMAKALIRSRSQARLKEDKHEPR